MVTASSAGQNDTQDISLSTEQRQGPLVGGMHGSAHEKTPEEIYSFSLVLLQCLLLALYRIVLPVLILIHCGIGLFCFPFLARIRFTLNVFRADIFQLSCRSESSNKSL